MARVSGMNAQNSRVYLNVYDLVEQSQNDMLYQFGLGMYHSGVHIGREEYTFASEAGIFTHDPKQAPGAKLRETIEMGVFKGTSSDLSRIVDELRSKYGGKDYNLLSRNCNNFADDFLMRVVGKPLPGFVNRMAFFGSFFSCLLPNDVTDNAPVTDGSSSSGGGRGGGYSSSSSGGYSTGGSAAVRNPVSSFSGSGMKLGSASGGTNEKGQETASGLNDRRDRMRAAAMARAEGQ